MEHIFIFLVVVGVAALIGSVFGFGNSLIIVPIMVHILPLQEIVPISSMVALTISVVVALESKGRAINREICLLSLGTLIGVPIGIVLLIWADTNLLELFLGLMLTIVSANYLFGIKYRFTKVQLPGYPFAVAAGILTGSINSGGPPLIVYGMLSGWDKEKTRNYMRIIFIPTNIGNLIALSVAGFITKDILLVGIACSAISVPITVVGKIINARMSLQSFRAIIWAMLLLIGVNLIRTHIS